MPRIYESAKYLLSVLQVDLDAGIMVAEGTVENNLEFPSHLLLDLLLGSFAFSHELKGCGSVSLLKIILLSLAVF